jgi:excisionase family DNA binding protein
MSARRTLKKKDLISQSQVCDRLGISQRTLDRWMLAGEFGYYDFRGTIKFDAREIEAYKRSHRVGPPLPPNLSLYPLPPVHDDRAEESAVSPFAESADVTIGENGGQP